MLNSAEKKKKLDHHPFQENGTNEYGLVEQKIGIFVFSVPQISRVSHLGYKSAY